MPLPDGNMLVVVVGVVRVNLDVVQGCGLPAIRESFDQNLVTRAQRDARNCAASRRVSIHSIRREGVVRLPLGDSLPGDGKTEARCAVVLIEILYPEIKPS